ncbi:dnaJ subfamily C member 17 [Trichonephila clavipes]|nr:dnaJ subfamily C member 17 [Trichonephila clavipes]
MEDLMKIDLYELLNISIKAEEKEIKKAYRKKALSCHPDKNPDNPKAAELFQQLSKALEVLTDKAARYVTISDCDVEKSNEEISMMKHICDEEGEKQDMLQLAEELGINATLNMTVPSIKIAITNSEGYEEEFVKNLYETIIANGKRLEELKGLKK